VTARLNLVQQIMKRLLILIAVALMGGLTCDVDATDSIYRNTGNVGPIPPVIDATNFVNEAGAQFIITTPFIYDTSNTENYTNKGIMLGNPGFRFDTAPSQFGARKMARTFRNHASGSIAAAEGLIHPALGILGAKLQVGATNLINEGFLSVGSAGLLEIKGKNVNLSRGGLQVVPLTGIGNIIFVDDDGVPTNFTPDVAVYDNYWGYDTNVINSAGIVGFGPGNTVLSAQSPAHRVFVGGPPAQFTAVGVINPQTFVFTNAGPPIAITITNVDGIVSQMFLRTNYTIQAAFVSVDEPDIVVEATFSLGQGNSLFRNIAVGMSTLVTNPVTATPNTMSLYLVDSHATETNRILVPNGTFGTARPLAYSLTRTAPIEFFNGIGSNSVPNSNLLFRIEEPFYTNSQVTAVHVGYSGTADILVTRDPLAVPLPIGSITNVPGRIEITADTLDLNRTRILSDGLLKFDTPHLIGSSNAVVDAWNLTFNLGHTNGNLRVQNMAKPQVKRFGGTVNAWSGLWTNAIEFVYTNHTAVVTNIPDPNDPGGTNTIEEIEYVPFAVTNVINYGIHALILNADGLLTTVPVTTHDFVARSANVTVADQLNVVNRFVLESSSFTIGVGGGITLGGTLNQFTFLNAPSLLYFTNNGSLFLPNEGHFGDDRLNGYLAFVNRGQIDGASLLIRSEHFENSGALDTTGSTFVDALSARMENGSSLSGGDLRVLSHDLKFRNYFHQAGGTLTFIATNSISDNGEVGGVVLLCDNGFNIQFANASGKPQVGDLLGTTIDTLTPIFASVAHIWPGDDRGVSEAGFLNNLALGRLIIAVGPFAEAVFAGSGVGNALYVDFLEIQGVSINDLEEAIRVEPNLVIYFADSNLPAEQLDGRLNGRLRWVSSFAGPNSSVNVVLPGGGVIQMNRSLRQSLTIDSDGDGLANGYDPSPLDPTTMALSVTALSSSPLTLELKWNASPNVIYSVEYRTSQNSSWQLLKRYTNGASSGPVKVFDQVPDGNGQRFYRVSYSP
jgi:hypothetical protein